MYHPMTYEERAQLAENELIRLRKINKELVEGCKRLLHWISPADPDADFVRQAIAKSTVTQEPEQYGCCCDLEACEPPNECVIDKGNFNACTYAEEGMDKTTCKYWVKISEWKKQQIK